jgi:hypothetical protein
MCGGFSRMIATVVLLRCDGTLAAETSHEGVE